MNEDERRERQARHKAFLATALGKAFDVWERAHSAYWQSDGYPDTPHKSLVRLAQHERAVYGDLLALLYQAAGLRQTATTKGQAPLE